MAICVATILLLEYVYRNYSTQADRVFAPYYQKAKTVETIYIGNSHIGVFNDLFPSETKNVGNMSLGGQDIFRMYTVLKTIIPKSPKLKKIYMGLDYDLIGYNQTKSGQEYIDREYFKYTGELYDTSVTNRAMSRLNFFRANRDISYLWKRDKQENKPINFIPVANNNAATADKVVALVDSTQAQAPQAIPHKQHDPFMCRKRAEEHSLLKFKQKYIAENLQFLKKLVMLCNEHNIELVLFDPPKTACYKSYCNKENIANAKHLIDSFALANKIPYLDFYDDTAFNDDMFVDYDHLNPIGVKILSDKIFAAN